MAGLNRRRFMVGAGAVSVTGIPQLAAGRRKHTVEVRTDMASFNRIQKQRIEVAWASLPKKRHDVKDWVLQPSEPFAEIEPAGGIEDNETIELIAFELHQAILQPYHVGNEPPTMGRLDSQLMIGFEPKGLYEGNETSGRVPATDSSPTDSDTAIHTLVTELDSKNIIWSSQLYSFFGFDDAERGMSGMTGIDSLGHEFINYRKEFGQGLMVDSDDRIYPIGTLQGHEAKDIAAQAIFSCTLYWDR